MSRLEGHILVYCSRIFGNYVDLSNSGFSQRCCFVYFFNQYFFIIWSFAMCTKRLWPCVPDRMRGLLYNFCESSFFFSYIFASWLNPGPYMFRSVYRSKVFNKPNAFCWRPCHNYIRHYCLSVAIAETYL